MKPRIRFYAGVWSCMTFYRTALTQGMDRMRIGYGYTPLEAYRDWEAQG